MNLRDLHYLVAVADLKSFSQAAEQCHISQPTLSAQIKKLEELLDVQIFERNNKRVMLTEVGERIIDCARRILREEASIRSIASDARDPFSGTFKLGAFPTLASYIFPSVVSALRADLPALKLMLVEEKTATLLDQLRAGTLDAAFIALPVQDPKLVETPLFNDVFLLAVPPQHELARAAKVDQSILKQYELLLLDEGHCLRDQALDVCHIHGGHEQAGFRATSLETLRQMVKAGTGVTLIPRIAISPHDTDIRYLPFRDPAPSRQIGLVWRKTTTRSTLIKRVVSLLTPILSETELLQ